ncbi:MAG: prepilin peptidase [Planctomycetaceae bacterium]
MDWHTIFVENWPVKLVSVTLIVAAAIDGKQLRVPNWLTFPMVISGVVFNTVVGGWDGLGSSLLGTVVGLACLLPLYSVGGMGAGDVKLLAGVGAWVGATATFYGFAVSTVVGAVMAVAMVLRKRDKQQHYVNVLMILTEWIQVRNPKKLAAIAAERKSKMLLLPYGIPICIGCISYFLYEGMLY